MSVSLVTSETISGDTFYRNKGFDISFSIVNTLGIDTSLSFSNSTYGVRPYAINGHFVSESGFPTLGPAGVLSADVLSSNPRVVTTVTPQSYIGTTGVCTDPSGNVYFAHANGNKIYKIDLSGVITTFAGTGVAGDSNGDRLTAQFRAPAGVITDGSGTFYVTDSYRVRKIDSNGLVSTIAGGTVREYLDGTGSNARFFLPSAMALRPNGDLLVTESDYHAIRNVTLPEGVVTTYAGRPAFAAFADGTLNGFSQVGGQFVFGANGTTNVYDTQNLSTAWSSTRTLDMNVRALFVVMGNPTQNQIIYGGTYSTTYGSPLVYQSSLATDQIFAPQVGFGTAFNDIRAIAREGSPVLRTLAGGSSSSGRAPFVSENNCVTWTDYSSGSNVLIITEAIAYGGGTWMAGGVGIAGSPSNLLISTTSSATAWTRTAAHNVAYVKTIAYAGATWAVGGSTLGGGGNQLATSTDSGATWTGRAIGIGQAGREVSKIVYAANTWVASFSNAGGSAGAGVVYSSDLVSWAAATGDFPSTSYTPTGLYYSTTQNKFIVSLGSNIMTSSDGATWVVTSNAISGPGLIAMADVSETVRTVYNQGTARMYFPYGLLYDPSGNLYIADMYNNRVRKVAAGTNTMTTFIGTGVDAVDSGPLDSVSTGRASVLARDSAGTIYVGSHERHTIQAISGYNVSLYAGAFRTPGYVDGAPLTARFNGIAGIATFGNALYIGEVYNADIRKLTSLPDVRPGLAPPGYSIIATSNYPITVNSRIDPSWSSVGGSISLFKYEPFNNTFTAKIGGDTLTYFPQSSTELAGYLTGGGSSTAAFRATNGATTAYSDPLVLDIQCVAGTTVVDSISTAVAIKPARLIVTPCNANLVFYRNEPLSPIVFSLLAADVSSIYSTSALPNGLDLVSNASRSFALTGTPLVQSLARNYTIVGKDVLGRTYSTVVTMAVNPERLILDAAGPTTFEGVVSTTPIAPVTFTSRFPPYTSERSMRYTWSQPPPTGLQFRDICGTALTGLSYSVNSTYDPTFSLTLSGTLTESQVRSFASNGTSTYTVSLVGTRTSPVPSLSPSLPTTLTFKLGQVILIDPSISPAFVGIRTSNWSYSAKSYFGTDVSIASIAVTEGFLPDGLDASFSSNLQRLDISGTPTAADAYDFTLTATAVGGGLATSVPFSLTPRNDSVNFTTFPTDTCFNFIQYRDLTNAKSGYYTSNLTYAARAASGCNVTITGSGLPDGVTLADIGSSTYRLTGRPTTAAGLSTATLTAFVAESGATVTTTFTYLVSADVFTFTPSSATYSFAQNIPITPIQLSATTTSENPIVRYSSGNLPPNLTLTNAGLITGTPQGSVDSAFTVTAFTTYSSGSNTYSYTILDDAVLLQPSVYSTVTAPGGTVSIPITGYSVSALTVNNYRFSNTFPYGLSINPTTGLLSGTLSSTLPSNVSFTLLGSAGIVDGSLGGTMTTTNLTVNRAEMIHIRNLADLTIFASDNNGATWSSVYTQSGALASSIGTNGSNVYLVPTSTGTVLRSTTGASYPTVVPMNDLSRTPYLSAVVNKTGTSIWWVAGSQSNVGSGTPGTRGVYLFTSPDDGLTWNNGVQITTNDFIDRAGTPTPPSAINPVYQNSVVLAYKDGVLLLGGDQILRSTDDGATWSSVSSDFLEVADFSVEHETVWVAAGTDTYPDRGTRTLLPVTIAKSLMYSSDAGETWTQCAGDFTMAAYEVRYGTGVWLATGFDRDETTATGQVRVSYDGVNWATITSIPSYTYTFGTYAALANPPAGVYPIARDDEEWKVLRAPADGSVVLYTHSDGTPMTTGWTSQTITGQFPSVDSASRFYSYVAQTVDPGADVTTITFPFPNTGPTFVSPEQSTYAVWQYMPIPPITFTAAGSGIVYFVSALPVGLVWDAQTRSVSGAPMRTGVQTFTVYAKNSGITAFTVTFIVEVPRIIKQQSGAGGYTSLLRQYTEVNAAQNARDSHVLPNESRTLGEFASPYPPSVVTPSNCPC